MPRLDESGLYSLPSADVGDIEATVRGAREGAAV